MYKIYKKIAVYTGLLMLSVITVAIIVVGVTIFSYKVIFEMKSDVQGDMQIYYITERQDFDEANSVLININKTDGFITDSVLLKCRNMTGLRFDPPGNFRIKSIQILDRFHQLKFEAEELLSIIKPINDIDSLRLVDTSYVEGFVTGNDPSFQLEIPEIINPYQWLSRIPYIIVGVILFFGFYLFIYFLFNKYRNKILSDTEIDIDIPKKWFKAILCCIFAWLLFQNVYYAFSIKTGISPDEVYHYHACKAYSRLETFLITEPIMEPEVLRGPILSKDTYFYHLLLGKTLLLNVFNIPDLYFLRFINALISIISLYLTYLLVKEITRNKWIQLSVLVVQTNILMYVFISSMIIYDNLSNLLAVLSFLLLLRYLKSYSRKELLMLLLVFSIGALTKKNFLPLIVIEALILLAYSVKIVKNWRQLIFVRITFVEIALIIFLAVFVRLDFKLWTGNPLLNRVIPSKSIMESMSQLINDNKEDRILGRALNNEKISSNETLKTLSIATVVPLSLINQNNGPESGPVKVKWTRMKLIEFVPHYLVTTEETIFGIAGHKVLRRNKGADLFLYRLLIFLSIFSMIINLKRIIRNPGICILIVSGLIYWIFVGYIKYNAYTNGSIFGIALQGRYNFPGLVILIVALTYCLLSRFNDRVKITFLVITTPLFMYYNFFWFLSRVPADWFVH